MADPVYTNDGVQIVREILRHLNAWEKKPCEIKLEKLEKTPPAMMLQQLSGAIKLRSYVNGSYVGSWPFAVYSRAHGIDTNSLIDGTGVLNDLAAWLEKTALPYIGENRSATSIQMTSAPCGDADHEDGSEDFQAIFQLQYLQKGRQFP